MIDFHCHLDLYPDPAGVARECAQRGMYVLSVTTTPAAWTGTSALAVGHTRLRTALGLHPQLAGQRRRELARFDELLSTTRYVGEVGLDGSPECLPYWRDQVEVFEHILRSCRAVGGRIVSIHSRRAEDEVLSRLQSHDGAAIPVLHWFSGSRRSLARAVNLGCWFSVGPPMLRSKNGRRLVEGIPQDRILTESDGPFTLQDGQAAMPWSVVEAIRGLADLWHVSERAVEERLLLNLRTLMDA
jgi:TatD DNase family protein